MLQHYQERVSNFVDTLFIIVFACDVIGIIC